MKRKSIITLTVATLLLVLLTVLTGCPDDSKEEDPFRIREREGSAKVLGNGTAGTGTKVTVKSASDWMDEYANNVTSYQSNEENNEHYNYPDEYTFLQTVYEGMAFFKFYNSARGHTFSLEDLYKTGRPHPLGNCFACKTPDFHALVSEKGNDQYLVPFPPPEGTPDPVYGPTATYPNGGMKANITNPISCFNCHANEPGKITVTHLYLSDALGGDLKKINTGSIACAQCHVEYYFGPSNSATPSAVILPYKGLGKMNPDDILKYYNDMVVPGATAGTTIKGFADYTNPKTGVRQIKIQHPEFETYYGKGGVHKAGGSSNPKTDFACADCHMPEAGSGADAYISHRWGSPLDNVTLINDVCSDCHTVPGIKSQVQAIQDHIHDWAVEIGENIESFTKDLAALIADTTKPEYTLTSENLANIRQLARNAQFYWDFVWVENSNGAHNSKLSADCLEKAEKLLEQAQTALDALTS